MRRSDRWGSNRLDAEAHHRAVSLSCRVMLVSLGVFGLCAVWIVLRTMAGWELFSNIPITVVLFVAAIAGMIVGFLWIRRIANDVGEV